MKYNDIPNISNNFVKPSYFNDFMKLLDIQSIHGKEVKMILHIVNELNKLNVPYEIDYQGNIFVTKGIASKYVCLCTHIDTVHEITSSYKIVANNNIIYGENCGVGGDDKCGIFTTLHILKMSKKAIKAAFFVGEECGCIGSNDADIKFFDNVGLIVGIDRRNGGDLITEYCEKTISKKCEKFLLPIAQKYDYKETSGLITDCFTIQERMNKPVSTVNVSCGYYNPHNLNEYIDLVSLDNCINFVSYIVEKYDNKTSYFHKTEYTYSYKYSKNYLSYHKNDSIIDFLIDNYDKTQSMNVFKAFLFFLNESKENVSFNEFEKVFNESFQI